MYGVAEEDKRGKGAGFALVSLMVMVPAEKLLRGEKEHDAGHEVCKRPLLTDGFDGFGNDVEERDADERADGKREHAVRHPARDRLAEEDEKPAAEGNNGLGERSEEDGYQHE